MLALSTQVQVPRPPFCLRRAASRREKSNSRSRGLAGDHQGLARLVVGDHALAHGGEQAFGRFPDDDEIDAALGRADDRARDAGNEPRRPHAGIEIEDEAQLDLRRDLGAVGVTDMRQPAGAEQDGVGLVAEFYRRVGRALPVAW